MQNEINILELLKEEGFYKLTHLKDFSVEEDSNNLALKKAEKQRFVSSLKTLEENNWQGSFETASSQNVSSSEIKEVSLQGVKMTTKLRKQFEKDNVIIINPVNEKHMFF